MEAILLSRCLVSGCFSVARTSRRRPHERLLAIKWYLTRRPCCILLTFACEALKDLGRLLVDVPVAQNEFTIDELGVVLLSGLVNSNGGRRAVRTAQGAGCFSEARNVLLNPTTRSLLKLRLRKKMT